MLRTWRVARRSGHEYGIIRRRALWGPKWRIVSSPDDELDSLAECDRLALSTAGEVLDTASTSGYLVRHQTGAKWGRTAPPRRG